MAGEALECIANQNTQKSERQHLMSFQYGICKSNMLEDRENGFAVSLPVDDENQASDFLESIFNHYDNLGVGRSLSKLGTQMPALRRDYENRLKDFLRELDYKIKHSNLTEEQIARWAVKERRRIATRIRLKQGIVPTVLFEVRDTTKYGLGGRTYKNMAHRKAMQGFGGREIDQALIKTASKSNQMISEAAMKGAKYLKHGGRVIWVFSLSATAYTILTAPEDELVKVLFSEGGAAIGGSIGTGLGVGACLVFGIATGGWGLLACGVVGGVLGGATGGMAGEKIYYSTTENSKTYVQQNDIQVFNSEEFRETPPMCY